MNPIPSPRRRTLAGLVIAAVLALGAAGCAQIEEAAPANGDRRPRGGSGNGSAPHHPDRARRRAGRPQNGCHSHDPQTGKLSVSYWAILYDSTGKTWVYTNPEARVYVRQAVTVERINGAVALLSDGPAAGTVVVTTGAEELYGAEFDTAH